MLFEELNLLFSLNNAFTHAFTEDVRTKCLNQLNKLDGKGTLPDRNTPITMKQQSSAPMMTTSSISKTTATTCIQASALLAEHDQLSASLFTGPANGPHEDQLKPGIDGLLNVKPNFNLDVVVFDCMYGLRWLI